MKTTNNKDPRSIDALVAEKIFDKHQFDPHHTNKGLCAFCNHGLSFDGHFLYGWLNVSNSVPHYSTQIAAAMDVVKALGVERISFDKIATGWRCRIVVIINGSLVGFTAEAETMPLATTLAALRAKGITI